MTSLKKQLELLAPLLDTSQSLHDIQISLLRIEPEEYFNENQGNILHQLGLVKNQKQIFSFDNHFSLDKFFEKLISLVKQVSGVEIIFTEKDGWNLTAEGKEFQLGKLGLFYDWIVNPLQIIQIPEFIKATASALKPYLGNGNLYYGYLKDEQIRKYVNFKFVLIFVKNEKIEILNKLDDFNWTNLGKKSEVNSGKVNTIQYKISSEKSEFKWKAKTSTLSAILFIASIVLLIALGEKLIKFSDRELPNWVFIYIPIIIIPFWILDYLNRWCVLTLVDNKITLLKGSLPYFPGYKKLQFSTNEIINIRTKLKANSFGDDDFSTGEGNDYSIIITTNKPKEISFIKHLSRTESLFLEEKLKSYCEQLKKV